MSCSGQIERSFTYHPPTHDQASRYTQLRAAAKQLAELIDENCPDSREKSSALTKLQESIMWANASIACNEHQEGG